MDRFITKKARNDSSVEGGLPSTSGDVGSGDVPSTSRQSSQSQYTVNTATAPADKEVASVPDDLGENEPNQPVLQDFPKTKYGKQSRSFQLSWYKKFPFLEYSAKRDAVYCYACRVFSNQNERDVVFTQTGFRNWRTALDKEKGFGKHAKTHGHLLAMKAWCERKQREEQDVGINKLLCTNQIERNRYYLNAIKDTVLFLVTNELPFRGDKEIMGEESAGLFLSFFEYTLQINPKLQEISRTIPQIAKYTSPEIQNEVIHTLSTIVLGKIVKEIRLSDFPFFSIKCDETKDRSGTENLSIIVRFIKDGRSCERFLGLIALELLDANSISEEIMKRLNELNININGVLSQCYDGASVMAGVKGGVQQLLQNKIGRMIPYIHCMNHQLHLVVMDVVSCEKLVRDFYDLCNILYKFIKKTHVRKQYHGTTLFKLLEQRWTGHLECTCVVLKNKEKIFDALIRLKSNDEVPAEISVEAAGIYSKVKKNNFLLTGIFLENLLLCLKPLNAILQDRNTDIVSALELLEVTIEDLKNRRTEKTFKQIWENFKSEKNSEENTSRKRQPKKSLADFVCLESSTVDSGSSDYRFTESNMRRLYYSILDQTISEIKTRFSEKNNLILRSLSCLLPRSQSFLNPVSCVDSIAKLIMSEEGIHELHAELVPAKRFLEENVHEVEDVTFILEFLHKYRVAYPRLYQVYAAAVTFGVSTSACERSFSFLNRILSPTRSSMLHSRKSDLVLLSVEKNIAKSVTGEEFLEQFKKKSRKLSL